MFPPNRKQSLLFVDILRTFSKTQDILKCIFPLEYGLHHDLIKSQIPRKPKSNKKKTIPPKRLYSCIDTIEFMISLHRRCNYQYLLNKFCPLPSRDALSVN
jgi:hypothetical protein